ncbi:MAG: hypothetical protein WCT30_04175 [Desulfurivibrionaceae bacterium]|jgi:hypothetical protein
MEWKIIIPSSLIIFGWFIVNWLSSKREFNSKRREVRVQYLVEAYRSIASASNRREKTTDEQKLKIEAAIEDIQLLGNERQLQALDNMIVSDKNNFTEILEVLRDDLRKELELKKVTSPLKFYRMNRG